MPQAAPCAMGVVPLILSTAPERPKSGARCSVRWACDLRLRDMADMSYEEARAELVDIVKRLESGTAT